MNVFIIIGVSCQVINLILNVIDRIKRDWEWEVGKVGQDG